MDTPNLEETQDTPLTQGSQEIKDNMFLGKECKRGHGRLRYRSKQECVQCARLRWLKNYYDGRRGYTPVPRTHARKKALAAGDKRYISRPCKYGHSGLRYTCTGECVVCAREHMVRYRAKISKTPPPPKNRQIAIRNNQKTYQGRPCKYGHLGIRYTKSCMCVECARGSDERNAYSRYKSSILRKDPIKGPLIRQTERESHKRWRQLNPEKWRRVQQHYRAKRNYTLKLLYYPETNL